MRRCPKCGEENPDRFRLCGYCGAQLAPVVASEVRKVVSIVFCDLKGSTDLGEHVDSEALRELLGRYFEVMSAILERHGGTVEKYIGDAIMAVFGLPRLHEDDALRAVRAAADMRTALASLNDEIELRWGVRLRNRTGVNTGEVVAGDVTLGQRLVTGDTVNVAARLEQAAPESDVLIGEPTYRLVREAVEVEAMEPLTLKGKAERVPAYRLIAVRRGEWFGRRLQAPLVGREQELRMLEETCAAVGREARIRAVQVLGHAGMGKTRLLDEFVARLPADALVLRGRCLSYGDGMTFWPVAEMVREAADIGEQDDVDTARRKLGRLLGDGSSDIVERLFAAIGLSDRSFPLHEILWGARKFVEVVSASRPLVLIFDDIHWAEQTLLDLIEHVVTSAEHARAFVVCGARHELFDEHKDWLAHRPNVTRIVLATLARDTSERIIANLLGSAAIPRELQERVITAADGNPLYVEQMLSMLIDEGALVRGDDGTWSAVAGMAPVAAPPTISALLAARLDRLPGDERGVIDVASVAGVVFHESAVQEVCPTELRDRVPVSLMVLTQKKLVDLTTGVVLRSDRAYRFDHILIRECAYDALLKRKRADLHERMAAWFETAFTDTVFDYEELIGYHLEQATRYLTQLGPTDERCVALSTRGSERLASAGKKALARGDMPAVANLLERAMALRAERDPVRLRLAVDLAEAQRSMGQLARARDVVAAALDVLGPDGDERIRASLRVSQLLLERSTRPDWGELAEPEIRHAIEVFDSAGDHLGLVRGWRLIATLHGTSCRYADAQQAAALAIDHARRAGDRAEERRTLTALALCSLLGPESVDTAVARCETLAADAADDRRARATILVVLAQLLAMRGEFARARALCREAHATLEDLGGRIYVAAISIYEAAVEMLAGDAGAAEEMLRPAYVALSGMGERGYLPTVAALLAEALYAQGKYAEADELARASERTASNTDVVSQYRWRSVRARLMARAGDPAAVDVAREGLRLVLATDGPTGQADAFAALADVFAMLGDAGPALAARERAAALYERKGDRVSTACVRAAMPAGARIAPR